MAEGIENIFFQWFAWEFFDVPRNILKAWKNFLKFGSNYFSIPLLIKTFFSHWRRYYWVYPKAFDIAKYLETFLSNLISRSIGAILRTFLIIIGLVAETFIFFLGLFIFFGWFLLPILLIFGFLFGIRLLI